jgi:hypothetical protein
LSLGEYVRVTQRFVDFFAHKKRRRPSGTLNGLSNLDLTRAGGQSEGFVQGPEEVRVHDEDGEMIDLLAKDLKVFLHHLLLITGIPRHVG